MTLQKRDNGRKDKSVLDARHWRFCNVRFPPIAGVQWLRAAGCSAAVELRLDFEKASADRKQRPDEHQSSQREHNRSRRLKKERRWRALGICQRYNGPGRGGRDQDQDGSKG